MLAIRSGHRRQTRGKSSSSDAAETRPNFIVAADCGAMISPMIAEGQVAERTALGIYAALLEEACFSSRRTASSR